MVTTESGLQYKDIMIGNGPSPPIGFQIRQRNRVPTITALTMSKLEEGIDILYPHFQVAASTFPHFATVIRSPPINETAVAINGTGISSNAIWNFGRPLLNRG
eukprot:Gb_16748 [translate_table: standard]